MNHQPRTAMLFVHCVLAGIVGGVVAVGYTRYLMPRGGAEGIIFGSGFVIGAFLPAILILGMYYRDQD